MGNIDGVYASGAKNRKIRVIKRLEAQLKENKKPNPENKKELVSLTDKDIARINKEIEILKTRV